MIYIHVIELPGISSYESVCVGGGGGGGGAGGVWISSL